MSSDSIATVVDGLMPQLTAEQTKNLNKAMAKMLKNYPPKQTTWTLWHVVARLREEGPGVGRT